MKIAWSELHHLPVQTESGQKIGVVEGITLNIDSHSVQFYEVKPGGVILGLFTRNLLVAPHEVIAITAQHMVVKDTVTAVDATAKQGKTRLVLSPKPKVEMQEME
jgi:sporulation protein YlmC with PRC-barrel domain